jgi:hypothetical protein
MAISFGGGGFVKQPDNPLRHLNPQDQPPSPHQQPRGPHPDPNAGPIAEQPPAPPPAAAIPPQQPLRLRPNQMQAGMIAPGSPPKGPNGFAINDGQSGMSVQAPQGGLKSSNRSPSGRVGPGLTPAPRPKAPVDATRPQPKKKNPSGKPPVPPEPPFVFDDAENDRLFEDENINNLQGWSNSIGRAIQRGEPVDKGGRAAWVELNRAQQQALAAQKAMEEDPSDEAAAKAYTNAQSVYRNAVLSTMRKYGGKRPGKPVQNLNPDDGTAVRHLAGLMGRLPIRKSKGGNDKVRYAAEPAAPVPQAQPKTSYIMASSNVGEQGKRTAGFGTRMGVDRGLANATTQRHQIAAQKAGDFIHRETGVKPVSTSAYGEWSDGDEDSVIHALHGNVPHEKLVKAAANIGYTQAQKAVLAFTPHDDGKHLFSSVHVSNKQPAQTIDELKAVGVPFRTIVPNPDGTHTVHMFDDMTHDSGLSATEKLHSWAQQNGYPASVQPGTGQFVGDSDWENPLRARAKLAYIGIDPSLKPGPDNPRPYQDRMVMTSKDTETKIRYAAASIMQQKPSAGTMDVITRYLGDLQKSDPDKFAKILNQHDVHGREIHYKWLDSLGEGTLSLVKKLAQDHQDGGASLPKGASASLGRLAKQILNDPTKHRTSLRELHHQLIKSGFYQPGVRPVWPDHERMLEVSGKLKESGRLGELDQYLQSVQQGQPMIDREETPTPQPAQQEQPKNDCPGCTGGMAEQVARLSARGIKVQFDRDKL